MTIHSNRLITETSPYLLQHAHNPVDWFPWCDEALALAKSLDKPMFISIGYSACHWCHVMEHESFEDEGIAAIMNKEFICVKVDREERPDIDAVFMQSVQLLNGHGGWPLNCFALPDGKPFWGGTYFRPNEFADLLNNVANLFRNRRIDLNDQAEQMMQGLRDSYHEPIIAEKKSILAETLNVSLNKLSFQFDTENGGFKGAPKFPMPVVWQMLLKYFAISGQAVYHHQIVLTLTHLVYGGIYDQVGGGFARYSTDRIWKVPHFEKMLYDNAQLISLFSEAYKLNRETLYLEVIDETLAFIDREMTSPGGGYYSALDADSEGGEGQFYVWGLEEWNSNLGEYAELLGKYFNLEGEGKWEYEKNILLRKMSDADFAIQNYLSLAELKSLVRTSRLTLLKTRETRPRPATDTKIIASWNAMMVKAYSDAYCSTGNRAYLEKALSAATFIFEKMTDENGRIFHVYASGKAHISGFLEDYAFLADSLLSLYQATFNEKWLYKSLYLAEYALEHFGGEHPEMLNMAEHGNNNLYVNPIEKTDGVIPSANAVLALTIFRLSRFFYRTDLYDRALEMLAYISSDVMKHPASYSHWLSLALEVNANGLLVVICGEESNFYRSEMAKHYLPFNLYAGSNSESKLPCLADRFSKDRTLIYICTPDYCMEPFNKTEEAILAIRSYFSNRTEN
jgi:uncharacterized protein